MSGSSLVALKAPGDLWGSCACANFIWNSPIVSRLLIFSHRGFIYILPGSANCLMNCPANPSYEDTKTQFRVKPLIYVQYIDFPQ